MNPELLATAKALITNADALVITAGAGIGVDSGLPDFRGNEGFWKAYPALGGEGVTFASIANPRAFMRSPRRAWGFYGHRLNMYRKTVPHDGFHLLKKWAESKALGAWVFTSNVDGHFQRAGFAEGQINECHGSIHHLQCLRSCTSEVWSADSFFPEVDHSTCQLTNDLPLCPHCGELARPNIVMFNDNGWLPQRSLPQRDSQERWFARVAKSRANVVVIEVGAGTAITSVRQFGARVLMTNAARLIRVNLRDAQLNGECGLSLQMGALNALVGIEQAMPATSAGGSSSQPLR